MSTTSNAFVIKCEARCEGRCVCYEPNSLLLTTIQGTQENLSTEVPAEPAVVHTTATSITNGRNGILRNRYKKLEEEDTRCLCHEKPKPTDRKARNKLIAACMIVFFFMIGEVVGKILISHLSASISGLLYSVIIMNYIMKLYYDNDHNYIMI